MIQIELHQLEDTMQFASFLAQRIKPGTVICLEGDLGAGKTTFTQFLCRSLEVDDYVTSPTFNLMNIYQGKLQNQTIDIYHFDVYRIFDADEMLEIGFDDYLNGTGICIVEWATQVLDFIPEKRIWITLTHMASGGRLLVVDGLDAEGEELCIIK